MPHVTIATYEDGVLKLDQPLPINNRQKVQVTVEDLSHTPNNVEAVRRSHGLVAWSGDVEVLDRLTNDADFDILESP